MRCHLRTSLQSLMQSDETKLKASAKMFHNHDATVVVNLLKVLGQKRRYAITWSPFSVHLTRSRAHLKQVSSPKPHGSLRSPSKSSPSPEPLVCNESLRSSPKPPSVDVVCQRVSLSFTFDREFRHIIINVCIIGFDCG